MSPEQTTSEEELSFGKLEPLEPLEPVETPPVRLAGYNQAQHIEETEQTAEAESDQKPDQA